MEGEDSFQNNGTKKMIENIKKNPSFIIGCTGFFLSLGVGAYKFKHRPKGVSAATFLVQLRVIAQSAIIGSIAIGMIYGMIDKYVLHSEKKQYKDEN